MVHKFLAAAGLAAMIAAASPAWAQMPPAVDAAVNDAARPEADKARDADRKPAEMLAFADVEPGDVVLEMLPGGGYFTRILARAVGPQGKVYAAQPPAADPAKPPPIVAVAEQYDNVTVIPARVGALAVAEPVDVIWTAQNYHDFHLARLNLDVAAVNRNLFETLKPGGTLLVIDHAAAAGAPLEAADSLHRIDPAKARAEIEAAGFEFVAESDALRNPEDTRTVGVFDPAIRGKTDQFVFKFRKPE
ncbi:methyltransferase [Phenylobacterium sp.]|uniref:class I SAM-dependent methyltransferase n=1 Tax=Phenylobacterium sp. TaxID=1871053 RepID=UPI0019C06789|nr:methyltransferase [Phenylobacterium sp.]MBC7165840.1 class I SAM-dependent methyltransferase [Phenylobacterium sp.]